ncbi:MULTISPECIES: hypothetical protein [Photobacterium]|jgi:hypothetical protein|uniref:hypothetical protein n=1 Tax=Photobacterium TaxID=657 RepID=UPI0007F8C22F|nr:MULTISPECIES: hypothetical protein [Photobacterium]OBU30152.1 hypothetical protein AYY23_21825 [Photobacterium kishitanii]PSU67297.1 hypothetical protein C9J22_20010 [Photobacterium phosphoreum]PSW46790.1 hypothetical protein C0W66_21635 [Photobacterium kishitanii]
MKIELSEVKVKLKEEIDGDLAFNILNKIKKLALNKTLKSEDNDTYDYLKKNCPRQFTAKCGNLSAVVEYIIENDVIRITSL